jgi:ATP-dependent protease ClpP protease subunit
MFYSPVPKRYMTKRSRLMAHQARDVYEGKVEFYPDDYISTRERLISLNKMLVQHYAQHLKISDTEIEKRIAHRRQWWIDPDEALKVGAVDGVVDSVASLMQKLDKK